MNDSDPIVNEEPRILNMRLQSSAYGMTIPVVWGTNRIAGNITWFGDFTSIKHVESQSSGGKGGGGVEQQNVWYTYTASFIIGLSYGVVESVGKAWREKEQVSLSDLGSLFVGSSSQTPWSYLTTNHPSEALAYRDISYVGISTLDLGKNGAAPQCSFEVRGRHVFNSIDQVWDADPKEIITDILTDPRIGIGFPAGSVADLTDYSNYCRAAKFLLSPALTEQAEAAQVITQILKASNSDIVWSGGKIKIVPYGDTSLSSSYGAWTANMTPQYDLGDDDFCPGAGDDPVRVTRKTPADAYNQLQVEYLSRANDYNVTIVEAKDQANIENFGLRAAQVLSLHCVCREDTAADIADILLRRNLYVRNEYEFELSKRHVLLEPMDLVTITDSAQGLKRQLVRILEISEEEDGFSVRAEEVPGVTASAALIQTQAPSGPSLDFNVPPGNTTAATFFEPPLALSRQPEVWIAAAGGDYWGGCEVWISTDDTHYSMSGILYGASRCGVLSASFASGSDPDLVNTLAVDLTASKASLAGGTQQDRDLYNTLCYVDGELVSYQNATLTSAYHYNLTSLRRGVYGTPISSHASGSKFVRCDANLFKLPYDKGFVGKTLYVKLRSFNIYGGAHQDIDLLTPTQYVVQGAAVGAINTVVVESSFVGTSAKFKWSQIDSALHYRLEVWAASAKRRDLTTTDTRYEYTYEDAKADGGPWRTIELRVSAVTETGESAQTTLQVSNPQVGTPTSVVSRAVLEGVELYAAMPSVTDYAGTRVWVSATQGFDPDLTTPTYDGPEIGATIYGLTPNQPYYCRIAHYDVFGKDNLTESSEISLTPRGVASTGADVVALVNSVLSGTSDPTKLIFQSSAFAVQAPDGNKYPFAVVDVGGGVYQVLLDANVLIGGNLSVENLTTGALPNDVIFSLGGGIIQLDGLGEIRVYAALGANQDFVSLTAAQLLFKMYISGVGYVTYNYLTRLESGTATSGSTVNIPGYWKQQPKVIVSPASLALYKTAYSNQDQSIQCTASNLVETTPGSKQWKFDPTATLTLGSNTGQTTVNAGSGDISANNWTSSTYTTNANCNTISPNLTVKSIRGVGDGRWYYRSIRWRVEYLNGTWITTDPWTTVNMGAQSNPIVTSKTFTFPSAAAWQWRIYCEFYDTDGTSWGTGGYEYSSEPLSGNYQQDFDIPVGGVNPATTYGSYLTLPASVLNPTWEIYEINYSANIYTRWINTGGCTTTKHVDVFPWDGLTSKWSNYEQTGGNCGPYWGGSTLDATAGDYSGACPATNSPARPFSNTVTGSNLTYSPNSTIRPRGVYQYAYYSFTSRLNYSVSITIKRRRALTNSTTPVNSCYINYYGWTLTSAQVLATGNLNWLAIGV